MLWSDFRLGFGVGVMDESKRNGINGDGLLRQAEEEFAAAFRSAPIESESELVQVVVEMLVTDSPLVGSHQPSLEERDDSVDTRQQLRGRGRGCE